MSTGPGRELGGPRLPLPGPLLTDHGVKPGWLEPAPASPYWHEVMARTGRRQVGPCSVCGLPCLTTRVIDTGRGRCWVGLCRDHTLAVWWPSSAMSMTLEGILAELGEVLAELGEVLAELGEVLAELGVPVAVAGLHRSGGLVR